ncbi:MAG: DUF4340 domain-containing protein [Spirochaetales bacterium]|nr:DUF4340 domain-containing protein [Spirochaetales bacterium]
MKKPLRLIIVVAAVGILIGAYFVIQNLPEKQPDYSAYASERYELISARERDLESMTFERSDGTTLVFLRVEVGPDDDKELVWTLDSPSVYFTPRERDIQDIAYSMSAISSDQIIDEDPDDLTIYGLDNPLGKAVLAFADGTIRTLTAGARTPTRSAFYTRIDDDPKVYAVRTYTIDKIFIRIDDLRDREIKLPNNQEISYFKLSGIQTLEITKMDEDDDFIGSKFSSLKLTKPYTDERSIDTQRFSEMMEVLPATFTIDTFVEDRPTDLAKYGLNPPKYEWLARDNESFIHLLVGNETDDGFFYVKFPDEDMVFTLSKSLFNFLDVKPITLVDKFVLIPNIDMVDKIVITGFEKEYTVELKREKNLSAEEGETEDEITTYFLDGKEIEEDPFKKFYQLVIGLLIDAENPSPVTGLPAPDVSVYYELNEGPGPTARADFRKLNHDFYEVFLNGRSEFLLSAYQIEAIFDGAAKLLE